MELIKRIKEAEASAKAAVEEAKAGAAKLSEEAKLAEAQEFERAEAERKSAIAAAVATCLTGVARTYFSDNVSPPIWEHCLAL